jgi:hypothetical protein
MGAAYFFSAASAAVSARNAARIAGPFGTALAQASATGSAAFFQRANYSGESA